MINFENPEYALEVNDVSFVYGEGTPFRKLALDRVSLKIKKGTVTGIIGHTGSGKSTLVQLFNGLAKPTSGNVLLFGKDINENKKTRREACFRVGHVFQYPEYQLFEDTVAKDIAFGPHNMGLSESEIAERVKMAADFVGFDDEILGKSPFDLSGGQKRRAAIAGILAMLPEVLVLDEPASGLDPEGRSEIFGRLLSYRDRMNATVVIVSHSMEDMARYADELIVMNGGKLFTQGSPREVFSDPEKLGSVGLGVPEITRLSLELKKLGVDLGKGVLTVDGALDGIKKYMKKTSCGTSGGDVL